MKNLISKVILLLVCSVFALSSCSVSEAYDKATWAIAESVKTKFEAKKTELLSEIALEPSTAHVIYKNYGGTLFKEKEGTLSLDIVKAGTLPTLQAVGGKK